MTNSFQSLQGVTILSKNAQKKISGGLAAAGTCAYESPDGGIGEYGISRAEAQAGSRENGTHWCCDSCMSASWYVDRD
jgi:hypothetical protein